MSNCVSASSEKGIFGSNAVSWHYQLTFCVYVYNCNIISQDQVKASDLFGPPAGDSRRQKGGATVRGLADEDDLNFKDLSVGHILETEELDFGLFGKSAVRQIGAVQAAPVSRAPGSQDAKGLRAATKDDFITGIESSDFLAKLDLAASAPVMYAATEATSGTSAFQFDFESKSKPLKEDANAFDINDYINALEYEEPASLFD